MRYGYIMHLVYDFSKIQKILNSEMDLATWVSHKGYYTKNRKALLKVLFSSLSYVIHRLCRKMENYAELDAKRARFFVSPFYFVFLRYTLKLGGTQVLRARNWQS